MKFPIEKLKPLPGRMFSSHGAVGIEIPLSPFVIEGQEVETSIRLDGIAIPQCELSELENRAYQFPVNPSEGYIDGSVYIQAAHHPVDVTEIAFGKVTGAGIEIVMTCMFVFEYEGLADYENTAATISAVIAQ